MKIKELIEKLSELDQEADIYTLGCCYGYDIVEDVEERIRFISPNKSEPILVVI